MDRLLGSPPAGIGFPPATEDVAGRSSRQLDDTVFIACGLTWAAGLIHVQAAIDHVDEYVLYALFFALLAPLQFGWGLAVCRRPIRRLLQAGAVASLLVAGLWLMSRTTGLPIGPEPWHPEAIGAPDVIATADEVITALLVFLSFWQGNAGWLQRASRQVLVGGSLCLILVSSLALVGAGHVH